MIEIIKEFWEFLLIRKKYWLFPLVIVFLLFGGLIILGETSSLTPFIYAIF
tara:strand:+ start:449 stop:601 length:153 start_codon:yes stop_codon:yes gene_type:complete